MPVRGFFIQGIFFFYPRPIIALSSIGGVNLNLLACEGNEIIGSHGSVRFEAENFI